MTDHPWPNPVLPPLTEAEEQAWRDQLGALPTVTVQTRGWMTLEEVMATLPEAITIVAPDGRRFTFDQSHDFYWEVLGSLRVVEE